MIYFDHNATTPIDERVLIAMTPYLEKFYGNPSSLYRQGRIARSAIDYAREQVAALVGTRPNQIVFTSGGTEANNLALNAVDRKLVISAIEHPSISEPAANFVKQGCELRIIPVDDNGLILHDKLVEAVNFKPDLVSVMLANNETGVIQDIAAIAAKIKTANSIVHTDAVQALGKIPLNFTELGVDLMSVSSHKIYGPKGCGALVVNKNIQVKPAILGGGQEAGVRAGTENVAAIVGFGKAAELAALELAQREIHATQLKQLLESQLHNIPDIIIFAQNAKRLPNTIQFAVNGIDGEMLLMQLDQKGFAISSGSACASGGGKPSPVLEAMGVAKNLVNSAVRISLGKDNTEAEIGKFISQLRTLLATN